jgi:orotidine-5'-phosphate decarboxylase
MRLAGVSVLTSHTPQSYAEAVGVARANLQAEVQRVTRLMVQAGMDAVVTSPEEIEMVRAEVGTERWIVVPGIRPPGAAAFDQRRTGDPAMAVAAGATHLVVGRPITDARDPRAVYEMLCDAIA